MKKEEAVQVLIVLLATVIACVVLVKEYASSPIEVTQISWNVSSVPEGVVVNEYSEPETSDTGVASDPEELTVYSAVEENFPININTATVEELDTLPGIGPVLAERIITYREENNGFYDIEEIMDVSGIGESTFEKLSSFITVE